MMRQIKFNIEGIHCRSCKVLIETEVDVLGGVAEVEVDHISGACRVEFDDEKISPKNIFKEIEKLNYRVVRRVAEKKNEYEEDLIDTRWLAKIILIPVALLFLVGVYSALRSLGGFELMARLNDGNVSYGIIFLIGLLAGFHCIGMCGGLVVAYSAGCLRSDEKMSFLPHLQYNGGRLISYAAIGGLLGGIGSFFGINPTFTGTVMVAASIFMVLMGLSFLTNWRILEKIKLRTPQFIARFLYDQKHSKRSKGPLVIGLLNGFMPCGPLQAMQLYALTAGSVSKGALSMLIYALGTAPLMFGFGSFISRIGQDRIKQIMKISGALIVLLGILMAGRGLSSFGISLRSGNIPQEAPKQEQGQEQGQNYQVINMDLTYMGYQPNVLYIKKNIPVRWVINVKQMSGCTNAIMIEELGIKQDLHYGENIIEFTPTKAGELKFSCWMRMVWGKFVVS